MSRIKIPEAVQAEVIFKSNRECCVCDNNRRGVHIHHIDGNNSNNKFENLAYLCFDCHHDASISSGSLKKKLTPQSIIKFRDYKYSVIAAKRQNSLKAFNNKITGQLTAEDLLTISKNAVIIIELEKIKEEYFSVEWNKRADILEKINKFQEHSNFRIAVDLFDFLSLISDQTRGGMKADVATSIYSLIICFFPNPHNKHEKVKVIELSNQCANIAFGLIYDSLIYLEDFEVAMFGLNILKFVYKTGKRHKFKELLEKVNETYNEIEAILKSTDKKNSVLALNLIDTFKKDLDVLTLAFPPISKDLEKFIKKGKKTQ